MSKDKFIIHVISVGFERLGELKVFVQSWLNQTENNWKLTIIHDGKNENFDNIEKLDYYEYGDWDNLSYYLSEKELERIKKQFDDDLEMLLEDDESDVDSCYGIFSSFLYCNDVMNDEKGYNFEYKDFVWCATD